MRETQEAPLSRDDRLLLRMHEYDVISAQIIHWDQHLWRQAQFFVAVESAFVAVVGKELIDRADSGGNLPPLVALVLSLGSALNLFLCYVWFRVGRRNLEYSGVRYARAKALEAETELSGTLNLYHLESETLREPHNLRHGSRSWVKHIPSVFILAWLGVLVVIADETDSWPAAAIPILLVVLTIIVIVVVEKSGRIGPKADVSRR
ncbi:MAG: hypothetical protein ACLQBX_14465 [Candidatus Limnocylindrales bacterium]